MVNKAAWSSWDQKFYLRPSPRAEDLAGKVSLRISKHPSVGTWLNSSPKARSEARKVVGWFGTRNISTTMPQLNKEHLHDNATA